MVLAFLAGFGVGVLAGVVGMSILAMSSYAEDQVRRMEVPMSEVVTVYSERVGHSLMLLERDDFGWRVSEVRNGLRTILGTSLPQGQAQAKFAERVAELRELAAAIESVEVEG